MDTTALRSVYDALLDVAAIPDFGDARGGGGTPIRSWLIF